MENKITVSQVVDTKELLELGDQWNQLGSHSPSRFAGQQGAWDLSFPWMLGWLSEIPEQQRELLVLIAKSGSAVRGILPLRIEDCPYGRVLSLVGAVGCFGDCKGIIACERDQVCVGEAFGDFLASEWLGQLGAIHLQSVVQDDPGIYSFVKTLVTHSTWSASSSSETNQRYVFAPSLGPDGEPIWPMAARRAISLVKKAYASGLFEYTEASQETGRQQLVQQALAIRAMLKNDAPELRMRFGSISMAQRMIDYRFANGTSQCLSKVGQLGSCNLFWKGSPIAGAMYIDYGHARFVFWMEVRVHPDQEQLVFWMLFSNLIRSSLFAGQNVVHLASSLGSRAVGFHDMAKKVCTIQAVRQKDSMIEATSQDSIDSLSATQ